MKQAEQDRLAETISQWKAGNPGLDGYSLEEFVDALISRPEQVRKRVEEVKARCRELDALVAAGEGGTE